MKITIAFTDQEKEDAAACMAAILRLHPRLKVRKSERHKPVLHLYLTSKKPENSCNPKENR